MRLVVSIACVVAILLSGCAPDRTADESGTSRTPPVSAHSPASTNDPAPAPTTDPVMDRGAAIMDYACDGGQRVAIIAGGDVARVTLKDGRVIELPRSSAETPPFYAGEALEFAVTSTGGMLGQDEGGGVACQTGIDG